MYQPFPHLRPRGKLYDLPPLSPSETNKMTTLFTFGSVCSGIEAVSVAWANIGKPVWFSEIEPFPCALLAHHYPKVPNVGDMLTIADKILKREIPTPDVLVGGTPCQAFSVAGKRRSLKDARGNLTLAFINIADSIDKIRKQDGKNPVIILWENVPGVLNTTDNAFGHFLSGLAGELTALQPPRGRWTGAGVVRGRREIVWRTLDAQYFGLAQRRKRVFVVAGTGDRGVAEILFERAGLPRNTETGKRPQQDIAAYIEGSFGAYRESAVSGSVRSAGGTQGQGAETLILRQGILHGTQDPIISATTAHCLGRNNGQENVLFDISERRDAARIYRDVTPTITAKCGTGGNNLPCIALAGNTIKRSERAGGNGNGFSEAGVSYTLTATDVHAVAQGYTIRKLTPTECERLQGFPDDYTKIPYRHKPAEQCPDSPRYKAIGNSMAVPVIRWIGQRLLNIINN